MSRALAGIAMIVLLFAAYEAGQRHAGVEQPLTAEAARSVSRYVVTPVWPGGAEADPAPWTDTRENSIRLLGPGISRDRQIRV